MSLVAMMIVSIGLSLAARSLFQLLFGGVFRPYRQYYRAGRHRHRADHHRAQGPLDDRHRSWS